MRNLFHFLSWKAGLARATTQTTDAERKCLARHAAGRKRVAEIGVWHGVTSRVLLAAMSPEGALVAIDPYCVGRIGVSFEQPIVPGTTDR